MNSYNTKEKHTTRRTALIGWLTALGIACTIALPQASSVDTVGTQNYVCLPSPSIGQVAWTLFTPQATLFSDEREQLTTHFFSPNPFEVSPSPFENGIVRATWEDSRDTSTVWGKVIASSSDPNFVAPGAIPWLAAKLRLKPFMRHAAPTTDEKG